MTAHNDLDRQLTDFLRDGPTELPYQSFEAVRDRTEQSGQRAAIGPWRLPEMNKIVTIALGAAAVVVLVFVGAQLFRAPGDMGVGSGADSSPEPTATTAPTATPLPTPDPPPPLTQGFTSTVHGLSLSVPDGWIAQAATEPWADPTFALDFGLPHADWIADPNLESDLFITIASQRIGDATAEEWVAAQMGSGEGCQATEPITVDAATGRIGIDGCNVVAVVTDGRGYRIQLYTGGDDPGAVAAYDRAWFGELLRTVDIRPDDAAD